MGDLYIFSPVIRKISNLFKQAKVHIAFRAINTVSELLKPNKHDVKNDRENSGIRCIVLSCSTCQLSYVGQAEPIRYIKQNNMQSAYA